MGQILHRNAGTTQAVQSLMQRSMGWQTIAQRSADKRKLRTRR